MSNWLLTGALAMSAACSGCASSSVKITGAVRPAIRAEAVRIYTSRPDRFEEIAVLVASRKALSGIDGDEAIEGVIKQMRREAAKLGANGLLLEDFSDGKSLTLATGLGADSETHNGSISLGVGGAIGIVKRKGSGRAIFITPLPP